MFAGCCSVFCGLSAVWVCVLILRLLLVLCDIGYVGLRLSLVVSCLLLVLQACLLWVCLLWID